jgi:hypothetical protein
MLITYKTGSLILAHGKVYLIQVCDMYSFKMAFVTCTLCNLNIPEIIISYMVLIP